MKRKTIWYEIGRAVGFTAAWGIIFGLCVVWFYVLVKLLHLAESWGWQ